MRYSSAVHEDSKLIKLNMSVLTSSATDRSQAVEADIISLHAIGHHHFNLCEASSDDMVLQCIV